LQEKDERNLSVQGATAVERIPKKSFLLQHVATSFAWNASESRMSDLMRTKKYYSTVLRAVQRTFALSLSTTKYVSSQGKFSEIQLFL
jgi:hypothetical protein